MFGLYCVRLFAGDMAQWLIVHTAPAEGLGLVSIACFGCFTTALAYLCPGHTHTHTHNLKYLFKTGKT